MDKIKVLVVDDAAFMRDIVKKGLRTQFPGLLVDECATGRQAQQRIEQTPYDLILCDWEMPEMRGDELLSWLRGRESGGTTPFVMVTSRGDKDHVVKAIELGVNNYLVKPFSNEKLTTVVARSLTQWLRISLQELKERTRVTPIGFGNDSAQVLGARDIGLSGAVPVAARVESSGPPPQSARPSRKVLAQLRFGNQVVAGLVKEIDLERVSLVLKRSEAIPTLLEPAVFDFSVGEGEAQQISRVNGYVHTLAAREDSRETEFINLVLRFVDSDPEKERQLTRYLASLQ